MSGVGPLWFYLTFQKGYPESIQLDFHDHYRNSLFKRYNVNDINDEYYPIIRCTNLPLIVNRFDRLWVYASVWNITGDPYDFFEIMKTGTTRWLEARYPLLLHRVFYGVDVYLFDMEHPFYSEHVELMKIRGREGILDN